MLSSSVISNYLQLHRLQPTRLLCPWNFPGKNTGVGCHFLFQGIFPTQGSTRISCISCTGRQILYHCTTWQAQTVLYLSSSNFLGFPGGSVSKESACNAGDLSSIHGLGRYPGRGGGQPTPVFLPRESPWTEKPGRLQSMGPQRVRHDE